MSSLPGNPAQLVIGLCTYNRGRKIRRTLEAVAAMDRGGEVGSERVTRLVVVDNNSTDHTGRIVDEFGGGSRGLPVQRVVEPVQGLAAARARLICETQEPLIAFVDDDVVPARDWALRLLDVFDGNPKAGMAGGRVELEFETGPTPLARRCASMLAAQDLGSADRRLDEPESCLVGAAFAARREAIRESGWLESRLLAGREGASLTSGEDYELAIRMRRAGWEVWYNPAARVRHLIPPERQRLEYLCRLARGVSQAKAMLKWVAHGEPGLDWATQQASRAQKRRLRSLMLEWRPTIRSLKLAEHGGRCEGWDALVASLTARTGAARPQPGEPPAARTSASTDSAQS